MNKFRRSSSDHNMSTSLRLYFARNTSKDKKTITLDQVCAWYQVCNGFGNGFQPGIKFLLIDCSKNDEQLRNSY